MHHAAVANRILPATSRSARRWRRMRARIGFMALWTALAVWVLGASMQVPGEIGAPTSAAMVHAKAPVAAAALPAQADLEHADLEHAAAWPRESADSWQAPSEASELDVSSESMPEPTPEQEAALYIAGVEVSRPARQTGCRQAGCHPFAMRRWVKKCMAGP